MKHEKPKLVCVDYTFLNDQSLHHMSLFKQYFDVIDFDPTQIYDSNTTFMYRTDESRAKVKRYEGVCKFILDNVWEPYFRCPIDLDGNTMGLINRPGPSKDSRILTVPKILWFETHFSQQDNRSLINDLLFTNTKTKSFLLQMGDDRPYRVHLYNALKNKNLLDNAVYSFLAYGIGLERNFPKEEYDRNNPPFFEMHYDPEWYNNTHFTLVVENTFDDDDTHVTSYDGRIQDNGNAFITEKTLKPIMNGHPFIILGDKGINDTLESWGFYTFPELFDHEFNNEPDLYRRIDMIVEQVAKYQHKDVKDKVIHNFNRFWNRELVEKLMIEELIEPILEFITAS